MSEHALDFDVSGVVPEIGGPTDDRIIAGKPVFTTWNIEEAAGGLYAGIWQSTPGKWLIVYDEWEFFHILEGHSVVTEEEGAPIHLQAGDSYIFRPGFRGTWEVLETTRKQYVIRL
jgi:uncharacterized cupin superfamily protein